jgi:hypothetical protein
MAAVTSEGAPGAHHQLAERLRAAVLGPRGGGTTRRRASDAFRLGLAVVVVAAEVLVPSGAGPGPVEMIRGAVARSRRYWQTGSRPE